MSFHFVSVYLWDSSNWSELSLWKAPQKVIISKLIFLFEDLYLVDSVPNKNEISQRIIVWSALSANCLLLLKLKCRGAKSSLKISANFLPGVPSNGTSSLQTSHHILIARFSIESFYASSVLIISKNRRNVLYFSIQNDVIVQKISAERACSSIWHLITMIEVQTLTNEL